MDGYVVILHSEGTDLCGMSHCPYAVLWFPHWDLAAAAAKQFPLECKAHIMALTSGEEGSQLEQDEGPSSRCIWCATEIPSGMYQCDTCAEKLR